AVCFFFFHPPTQIHITCTARHSFLFFVMVSCAVRPNSHTRTHTHTHTNRHTHTHPLSLNHSGGQGGSRPNAILTSASSDNLSFGFLSLSLSVFLSHFLPTSSPLTPLASFGMRTLKESSSLPQRWLQYPP